MNPETKKIFETAIEAYRVGDFEIAVHRLNKCLQAEPDAWDVRFYLAMTMTRLEETRDAKRHFMAIRDLCPDPELRKKASSALAALVALSLS